MRRHLTYGLTIVALLLAGCGSANSPHVTTLTPKPKPSTTFVCHHKEPAQAGECIRQELEARSIAPAPLPLTATFGGVSHPQCVDVSRWQPHPRWHQLRAEGIVCVIVQGADNCSESNPFFTEQVHGAHEVGMKIGAYVFVEGDPAWCQASALVRAVAPVRKLITLGGTGDAEESAAYPQECAVLDALARDFAHVLNYGSPGTSRTGRCKGYVWGACWGGGPPCTLPSYPFSAIRFRQWCGTCRLGGNDGEIDRDEDRGLLALSKPKPKALTKHQRLQRELKLASVLLADLHRHGCFHVHGKHAFKLCPRWGKAWRSAESNARALRS